MKKKILIFNVAAQDGGALTVLNYYYEKAIKNYENEYVFILSNVLLNSTENVKVLNYGWIKKSWIHRIFFEIFIAPSIYKNENPDEIVSLQNLRVLGIKQKQTILIQNVLPFSKKQYKFYEDQKIWIYQKIMSKLIIKTLSSQDLIIVQNNWMKKMLSEEYTIPVEKIKIENNNLKVAFPQNGKKRIENNNKIFFYPANAMIYKNHEVIVKACKHLKKDNINNYKVVLTLTGSENRSIKRLRKIALKENLPIEFLGYLNKEKLEYYYKKSILLFPSYIETVGLPLIECQQYSSPIICSNYEFAINVTNSYKYVKYFNPEDDLELFKLMRMKINSTYKK